jgi:hypothetical protein
MICEMPLDTVAGASSEKQFADSARINDEHRGRRARRG